MNGWIKLHRSLLKWEWYDDHKVFKVFMHIILTANHETKKWHGIEIRAGCVVTSYANIANDTKMSVKSVRTVLKKLKNTGEVAIKTTNKYTLIEVNNWKEYQIEANKGQTKGKQRATTKERKKERSNTPNGDNQNNPMYEEPTINVDDDGEVISTPSKPKTFGRYPAKIAGYYCKLMGKTHAGRQLPAGKDLMKLAQDEYPNDDFESLFKEILDRIDLAKKYYDSKKLKDWNLSKVAENWNKILTEWIKEVEV